MNNNCQSVNFTGTDNVTYVNTIADLRLIKPSVNGEVIMVAGRTVIGDGDGANYVWSDTSGSTDDGVNVIASQYSSTLGRWLIIDTNTSALSLRQDLIESDGGTLIGYQYN